MRTGVLMALALAAGLAGSARAEPPPRIHVLAIGYNGAPGGSDEPRLRELRYADDDAAAFARLARDLGGHAIVLSTFDQDTTRRFPGLSDQIRPPLQAELRAAVGEIKASLEQDRRAGLAAVVLVTYSGHGVTAAGEPPALLLADGKLTQQMLYDDVLKSFDSTPVHVIVDACHAEAIVRPRDVQAGTAPITESERHTTLSKLTLQGMPQVGAMIASSASAQAHEWDAWQHGVFTHEVISGLRGAADVNGDLRVEYSEMAAFLSAANREVSDRAARIKPVLTPPPGAPRSAIVDLRNRTELSFLLGHPGQLGGLWVESEDGLRIADLRSERDHFLRLLVPSGRLLFVRGQLGEARLMLAPGEQAHFDTLALQPRTMQPKGVLDLSLRRGLFATTFGPSYYRGFVDRNDELLPVSLPQQRQPELSRASERSVERAPSALAWTGVGVTGALVVASAIFGGMALDAHDDFDDARGLERASLAASDRYEDYRALSIGALVGAAVTGGVSAWLLLEP